ENAASGDLSFSCALIPIRTKEPVEITSLRLEGAMSSGQASLEHGSKECTDSVRVTFRNLKISDRVKKGVTGHPAVVDTIYLKGDLKTGTVITSFSVQAPLEFVSVQPAVEADIEYNRVTSGDGSKAKTKTNHFVLALPSLSWRWSDINLSRLVLAS